MLLSWGKRGSRTWEKKSQECKASKANSQRKLIVSIWAMLSFAKTPEAGIEWMGEGAEMRHTKPSQQQGSASATNPGLKSVGPHPVPCLSGLAGCLRWGRELKPKDVSSERLRTDSGIGDREGKGGT